MKKFDFVAELLAHGFHDDTKLEAVELSRQTGFEGVVLSRDFTKVIESVWSGRHHQAVADGVRLRRCCDGELGSSHPGREERRGVVLLRHPPCVCAGHFP